MIPAVRYCRCACIDLAYYSIFQSARLGNQLDTRFDIDYCFTAYGVVTWFPACGIIFSFSMLLVNTLLSSTLSMLSCQLIRLDASNSRSRVDEASSSSRWWGFAMLFFLLLLPSKRLLSFLLPTNTTFLFVVLVLVIALASYPYSLALVVLGIDTLLVLVLWECSCRHSMQEGSQFV